MPAAGKGLLEKPALELPWRLHDSSVYPQSVRVAREWAEGHRDEDAGTDDHLRMSLPNPHVDSRRVIEK